MCPISLNIQIPLRIYLTSFRRTIRKHMTTSFENGGEEEHIADDQEACAATLKISIEVPPKTILNPLRYMLRQDSKTV